VIIPLSCVIIASLSLAKFSHFKRSGNLMTDVESGGVRLDCISLFAFYPFNFGWDGTFHLLSLAKCSIELLDSS
jgi:hypothetical protein